ncbi:IS66 family insertion sequence element accessory protein TnpB [Lactiplantibacillus sp. DA1]|nr:IS66 family insertion sequence element accessory protein TnpB [Lactiplantibacillus sp. DA1]MDV0430247.1 IS66 family insertion sequence element accessory protein TnpB [Lactiplantibacillus sp. DA1]
MTNRLIDLRQLNQIYIVCGRTDLRKGIDGLATLIQVHNLHHKKTSFINE